ncbi:hypothetical protein Ddc_01501 [Ditylenchus destructor]|nr:hypothetical protein Ddc_01501 [Ditylenchus destructor]
MKLFVFLVTIFNHAFRVFGQYSSSYYNNKAYSIDHNSQQRNNWYGGYYSSGYRNNYYPPQFNNNWYSARYPQQSNAYNNYYSGYPYFEQSHCPSCSNYYNNNDLNNGWGYGGGGHSSTWAANMGLGNLNYFGRKMEVCIPVMRICILARCVTRCV